MTRPRLLYLNGAFDVTLSGQSSGRFQDQIAEMSAWYLPVGDDSDRVILHCQIPEDYVTYWKQFGIHLPKKTSDTLCSDHIGDVWGWDQNSVDVMKKCGADLIHPALYCVSKANSRAFSYQLAQENGDCYGIPGAKRAQSFEDVQQIINSWQNGPFVIKPDFGNSGIGFVKLTSREDFTKKKNRIEQLFHSSQSSVIIEPWFERIADFSSHFILNSKGETGPIQRYSTLITSGGAFYGMHLGSEPVEEKKWLLILDSMVKFVSRSLHQIGYFGPVSVDSMVVKDPKGAPLLIPLVEINARWSMFRIANSIRQKIAPTKRILFRTLGRKRHRLPSSYKEWNERLGSLAFNPDTQSGVVCVSPLQVCTEKDWQQPARTLLFLAASNPEQLRVMNRQLTQLITLNPKTTEFE